jgi:hypothetical protein
MEDRFNQKNPIGLVPIRCSPATFFLHDRYRGISLGDLQTLISKPKLRGASIHENRPTVNRRISALDNMCHGDAVSDGYLVLSCHFAG